MHSNMPYFAIFKRYAKVISNLNCCFRYFKIIKPMHFIKNFFKKIVHEFVKILYTVFYPKCCFEPWPYVGAKYNELILFLIAQKILGLNAHSQWPIHFTSKIICPRNIHVKGNSWRFFLLSPNCYYQAGNPIYIGENTMWGPSVGFVAANHSRTNLDEWTKSDCGILIGDSCWIGMHSVLVQGSRLADNTVVGANSLVNREFSEKHLLIGGSPAVRIKHNHTLV